MRKDNPEKGPALVSKVLLPIVIVFVFLLSSFIAAIAWLQKSGLENETVLKVTEISNVYYLYIDNDLKMMKREARYIKDNKAIRSAFTSSNRELLLNVSMEKMEEIRYEFGASHFYFHDEKGDNFLRVHKPARYGDLIDRKSMLEALRTGEDSSSIEVGPLGTFTVRYVSPWKEGDRTIGHVELGKDSMVYIQELKKLFDVEVYLFARKSLIKRSHWEDRITSAGKPLNWDTYGGHILVEQTAGFEPPIFKTIFKDTAHQVVQKQGAFRHGGRHYAVGTFPVNDIAGNEVGDLAILIDATEHYNALRDLLLIIISISIAMGIILIYILYRIVINVEIKLVAARKHEMELKQVEARESLRAEFIDKIQLQNEELRVSMEEASETQSVFEVAEKKLRLSEGSLAKAQRIAHIGSWEWDIASGKLTWSDEVFRIFGYEPGAFEATYEAFLNAIHPGDRDIVTTRVNLAVEGEKDYDIDHRIVLPDGSERVVHEYGEVEFDDEGSPAKMIGTIQDITVHKEIEHALKEAKKAADNSSRTKSEFLSNMSHEIRTPMTTIFGMAELLTETDLDEMQADFVAHLIDSSDSLLNIINDILDISKIEAGKMTIEERAFDIEEEIDKILKMFKQKSKERGVKLSRRISSTIPKQLIGDPVRLRQVLVNLIGNAIKFTENGSVSVNLKCDISSHCSETCAMRIAVNDTGIGIEHDKLKTIFEEFSQADTSITRTHGGTGLGLTISRKLVEIMGGELHVESTVGKGSNFYFTLDLKIAPQKEAIKATPKKFVASIEDLASLRILLADDSEDNRLLINIFLKETVHALDFAENGEEAFEMFTATDYDLVLMDMQMPVLDGYEATRLIRKWEEDHGKARVPIIAFTACVLKEEVEKCMQVGCSAHLAKPVKKKDLLEIIGKHSGE